MLKRLGYIIKQKKDIFIVKSLLGLQVREPNGGAWLPNGGMFVFLKDGSILWQIFYPPQNWLGKYSLPLAKIMRNDQCVSY
jgi:hypothetical protein